jgi:hypothetical protein
MRSFLVVWLGALVLGLDVVWCACLGWACLRFCLPLFSCVCMGVCSTCGVSLALLACDLGRWCAVGDVVWQRACNGQGMDRQKESADVGAPLDTLHS